MSRQIVMSRRGKPVGYIDTAPDGQQNAIGRGGILVGIFHPHTGETVAPTGHILADGNLLSKLLREHG